MAKRDVQKRIDVQDSYQSGYVQVFGGSGAATPTGDFLRRDGTTPLEGNLIVLDGILIDGVDLSAFKQNYDTHVSNPNAHHPTAGQGQGITVDGSQIVSVRRATVSGLEFDGGGALQIADSISGVGLGITGKVLRVDQNYAFTWTNNHTFDTDTLYVSATHDAVWVNSGAPTGSSAFKVTSSAVDDYTMHLKQIAGQTASMIRVEDIAGNALIQLTGQGDLQSGQPGFVSGLTGWEISAKGRGEFNDVFVRGELHATVFVADEMHATGGTQVVMTATRVASPIVGSDNVLPALNGNFTLVVDASWDTGLCYFSLNDIVRIKAQGSAAGGIDLYDIYAVVNATPVSNSDRNLLDGKPGTFDLPCVLRNGGSSGVSIPAGTAVVRWGKVGQSAGSFTGGLLLTSDLQYAPYLDIFTVAADVSAASTWGAPPTIKPRVRVGNLDGVLGLAEQWGIAAGTDLSDTSNAARYIVASDQQLKLQNVDLTLFTANIPRVQMQSSGVVKFGTDIGQATTTAFEFNPTTGATRLGVGSGGAHAIWTGSNFEIRNSSGSPVITLDGAGGSFFSNVMTIGTSGEIRQGTGTLGSTFTGVRLWRDTGGVGLLAGYNNNLVQWQADTAGKLRAGNNTIMLSRDGLDIEAYTGSNPNPTENVKSITFWGNLANAGSTTVKPTARIWGGDNVLGQYGLQFEVFHPTDTQAYPKMWLNYDLTGSGRQFYAGDLDNFQAQATNISLLGALSISGATSASGHMLPGASITYDLGSSGLQWRKLYVNELIAGTVTGGTQLTGQIWQYDTTDMYVRSNSTSARTLFVTNPGTGTMHLDVEGNITLGGTVDGVDIFTFKSGYDSHVGNSDAHHARAHSLTSAADHPVSGLTTGTVLKATSATAVAFGAVQFGELGGSIGDGQATQFAKTDGSRPFTATVVINPTVANTAPFSLGANAQGALVAGLNSAQLGGFGAADYARKAESANITGSWTVPGNWSISGGWTFTNDPTFNPSAVNTQPFAIGANATGILVPGLNSERLGGYLASEFPRKIEAATVSGTWLFSTSGTTVFSNASSVTPALRVGDNDTGGLKIGATTLTDNGSTFLIEGGSNFQVDSDIPNTYLLSPSVYLGGAGSSTLYLRSNYVDGGSWSVASTGAATFTSVKTPNINNTSTITVTTTSGDIVFSPPSGGFAKIAAGKAFRTNSFASGFTGNGAQLDDGNLYPGKTHFEVDSLTVRGPMNVYELRINQIRASNGSLFVSGSGKVVTASLNSGLIGGANSIYILGTGANTYHGLATNDLIRAQAFTGSTIYQIDMEVTSWTSTTFTAKLLAASSYITSLDKFISMEFVRIGNTTNADRQGALYFSADDSGSPFMDVVDGITAHSQWNTAGKVKVRVGRLTGLFGVANEYGIAAGRNGYGVNDSWIRYSDYVTQQNNVESTWYASGVPVIKITPTTGFSAQTYVTANTPAYDSPRSLAWFSDLTSPVTPDAFVIASRDTVSVENRVTITANLVGANTGRVTLFATGNNGSAFIALAGGKTAGSVQPSVYVSAATTFNNSVSVNNATVNQTFNVNGGAHITGNVGIGINPGVALHMASGVGKQAILPGGNDGIYGATHFNYTDGKNYIRGNTTISDTGGTLHLKGVDFDNLVRGATAARTTYLSSFVTSQPSGFYDGNDSIGSPTAGTWYSLINVKHNNVATTDHGMQIAQSFYDSRLYHRNYASGIYYDWRRVADIDDAVSFTMVDMPYFSNAGTPPGGKLRLWWNGTNLKVTLDTGVTKTITWT